MKEERNDAFILYYVYIYKNVVSLFANARKREREEVEI